MKQILQVDDTENNKVGAVPKMLKIHSNPSLDEVWDLCVRNLFYDRKNYINCLESLFKTIGIDKISKIADVSAGGGFPAQDLIQLGYKVDCFDGFADELFNKNASLVGLDIKCQKVLWQSLPEIIKSSHYDFVFCRGNSFIYAGGGWDNIETVDVKNALTQYEGAMKIFASLIRDGGYMYIDKFKDSELDHREKLATIKVGNQSQDLFFSSRRFPGEKVRQVFMERVVGNDVVAREQRVTYDLSGEELQSFLQHSGFSEIKPLNIPEESHFDVWLAKR